jgi:HK97 gp10 family phage protein
MKEFTSLGQFARHLATLEVAVALELRRGLDEVATAVRDKAKDEIGSYQAAIGPFPAWAQLAESTVEDRVAKGYSPDQPLLRSGEMRDSIGKDVSGIEATIGSTSQVAVYQELGTDKIPPRPFLGPAVLHNEALIKRILGKAFIAGLLGRGNLPRSLGYDTKID